MLDNLFKKDFLDNIGVIEDLYEDEYFNVFAVSYGDGKQFSFEVLNQKYTTIVFSYDVNIEILSRTDIESLYSNITEIVELGDVEDYVTEQFILLIAERDSENPIGKICTCKPYYCNYQFNEIIRKCKIEKMKRDTNMEMSIWSFVDICNDLDIDAEIYPRCGTYIAEGSKEEGKLCKTTTIFLLPIGEYNLYGITTKLRFDDEVFAFPIVRKYGSEKEYNEKFINNDEWYEKINDNKFEFIDGVTEFHKII